MIPRDAQDHLLKNAGAPILEKGQLGASEVFTDIAELGGLKKEFFVMVK